MFLTEQPDTYRAKALEEPQPFVVQDLNPVPFQNTGDEVMSLTFRTDSSIVAKANSLLEWSYTAYMVLSIGFRVAVNAPSRFASCDDLFSPLWQAKGAVRETAPCVSSRAISCNSPKINGELARRLCLVNCDSK